MFTLSTNYFTGLLRGKMMMGIDFLGKKVRYKSIKSKEFQSNLLTKGNSKLFVFHEYLNFYLQCYFKQVDMTACCILAQFQCVLPLISMGSFISLFPSFLKQKYGHIMQNKNKKEVMLVQNFFSLLLLHINVPFFPFCSETLQSNIHEQPSQRFLPQPECSYDN